MTPIEAHDRDTQQILVLLDELYPDMEVEEMLKHARSVNRAEFFIALEEQYPQKNEHPLP